jgi:hypothetical protein
LRYKDNLMEKKYGLEVNLKMINKVNIIKVWVLEYDFFQYIYIKQ